MEHSEAERVGALHALGVLDTPREERYDRVVRLAQQIFGVGAAAVNLVDADRQWTKAEVGLPGLVDTPRRDSFCARTVEHPGALVVPDAAADDRFRTNPFVRGDPPVRFYAGHPLRAPGGERIGSLCLTDPVPRELTAREQAILAELAGLVEHELAAQHEIDHAGQVQRMLMPRTAPSVPGWDLAARWAPARELGGDFYDWWVQDGRLQLHVADVMGKGLPAALLAASVRAVLHGSARYNDQRAAVDRAGAALESILEDTGTFVTAFAARVDLGTGALDYVDAGHGLAVVCDPTGAHRRLCSSGLPLGALPGSTWEPRTERLAPGETLLVISDGLLDYFPDVPAALARAGRAVADSAGCEELVERVLRFALERGLDDDVTVLALRRAG